MGKIKMVVANDVTFEEGCEEYLLDCKARNLRDNLVLNDQSVYTCRTQNTSEKA